MLLIIHKDIVNSTQDYAYKLLASYTTNIVVIADIQTAGRGSHRERIWVSNNGNFHGSFIIDISKLGYTQSNISLLNSHVMSAIQQTISNITGSENIRIKLPNDIYYNGKKIAGVLIETFFPLAIIGIGINLVSSPLDTSTSIKDAFGVQISNTDPDFINLLYKNIIYY